MTNFAVFQCISNIHFVNSYNCTLQDQTISAIGLWSCCKFQTRKSNGQAIGGHQNSEFTTTISEHGVKAVHPDRARNVHCTSLRLTILIVCNTSSALYEEGWYSMKR